MNIVIFIIFLLNCISLVFSIYYAGKLYANIDPRKEKWIRCFPLFLFSFTAYKHEAKPYYWKFMFVFTLSIFLFYILMHYKNMYF